MQDGKNLDEPATSSTCHWAARMEQVQWCKK